MRRLIRFVLRAGFLAGSALAAFKLLQLRQGGKPEIGDSWSFTDVSDEDNTNGAANQKPETLRKMPPTQTGAPKVAPKDPAADFDAKATIKRAVAKAGDLKDEGVKKAAPVKKEAAKKVDSAKKTAAKKVDTTKKEVAKKQPPPKKAAKKKS